jgi:hypothetical protein
MPKITVGGGATNALVPKPELEPAPVQESADVPEAAPAAPAESEPAAVQPALREASETSVPLNDPAWPDRPPEVLVPQVTVVRPAGPQEP